MMKNIAAGWNENVSSHETPNSLLFVIDSHHGNFSLWASTYKFAFRASEMSNMAQKSRPLQHENDIEFLFVPNGNVKKWVFAMMRWRKT